MPVIVTLSSIPPRFADMGPTLASLLAQDQPADRIILYIPNTYRRFPEWDGVLPKVPEGVEIHRCDTDYGPATKVLPALRAFAGQDVEILFCDDDRAYSPRLIREMLKLRRAHPEAALCNRTLLAEEITDSTGADRPQPFLRRTWRITDVGFQLRFLWAQIKAGRNWRDVTSPGRETYKRSGHTDIFEGCGGVMVRPEFFPEFAFEIPEKLWMVDDIWLSGVLAANKVPIWFHYKLKSPPETRARDHAALSDSVIEGLNRDAANRNAAHYLQQTYGIWP